MIKSCRDVCSVSLSLFITFFNVGLFFLWTHRFNFAETGFADIAIVLHATCTTLQVENMKNQPTKDPGSLPFSLVSLTFPTAFWGWGWGGGGGQIMPLVYLSVKAHENYFPVLPLDGHPAASSCVGEK